MTEPEALQEARRRFGPGGFVRIQTDGSKLHTVGLLTVDFHWVKGTGRTWEEAFEGADKNAKKQG